MPSGWYGSGIVWNREGRSIFDDFCGVLEDEYIRAMPIREKWLKTHCIICKKSIEGKKIYYINKENTDKACSNCYSLFTTMKREWNRSKTKILWRIIQYLEGDYIEV